jgi:ATP-dependent DNA helicase RecG
MENLLKLRDEYGLPVEPVLLTGSVKGKARKEAYKKIASGEADIIIGTHALIQEAVEYRDLGLVITDEQHRFGVRQRENLAGKGKEVPVLVMSATPIPRTLAIIMYGDLQISVLDEMPKGRLPIKNLAIDSTQRRRIYRFIYGQLKEGRQAYVICPEVEEGEMSELENVQDYTEKLRKIFPSEVRIDSLNGRMKPKEKTDVMERFSEGRTDILVSTTVIEVGIDVPNASVIAIENAERFGMSQLHQLRGRVGRGKWQSYCIFLFTPGSAGGEDPGKKPKRLEILEKTNDGFVIAEEDLKLRGPGDLFGERQSGALGFVLADIYEDSSIMKKAAAYVDEVLLTDPGFEIPSLRKLDFRTI